MRFPALLPPPHASARTHARTRPHIYTNTNAHAHARTHTQVSVGDGWAPYIVRPLAGNAAPDAGCGDASGGAAAGGGGMPAMNRGVALFFVAFFFASGICLLGVRAKYSTHDTKSHHMRVRFGAPGAGDAVERAYTCGS